MRLLTRNGHDWALRYPLIAEAVRALPGQSCVIDGEAVAVDSNGLPSFDRLRFRRDDDRVVLFAFDLLQLDGTDLRREALEHRKDLLVILLTKVKLGLHLNEHIGEPGEIVFEHACKLGFEGIVSKRLGSRYVSGRSRDWLKCKNPTHQAATRELEDWGRR